MPKIKHTEEDTFKKLAKPTLEQLNIMLNDSSVVEVFDLQKKLIEYNWTLSEYIDCVTENIKKQIRTI